ncbi:MAG: glucosaminidase domain-containing protein [Mucilaginibacter sp.]
MSKEFFEAFPTLLGVHTSTEVHPQDLAGPSTQTGDKRADYVKNYYGIAEKVGKEFNLNPLVILAQAAIESGWGTSLLSRENHNFFGITAYGPVNKYWHGAKRVSTSSGLPFRSYDSVDDCFRDFANLITSHYKAAAQSATGNGQDVTAYANLISASPYINEKNGDNRSRYKQLIIQNAAAIIQFAKKFQSLYN